MGDRCYLKVWTKPSNIEKFLEVFELPRNQVDIEKINSNLVEISLDEVNYGGEEELSRLAETCSFCGYHSQGEEYGSYKFFSEEGSQDIFYQEYGHSGYVIAFDESGSPHEGSLEYAKHFIAKYGKLKQ